MDDRERATVLAALRHWQNVRRTTAWAAQVGIDLIQIVTDMGKLIPLNDHEIDELCERINVEDTADSWYNQVNTLLDDLAGGGYDDEMMPPSLIALIERAAELGTRKRP